jgi:hypothetical protein
MKTFSAIAAIALSLGCSQQVVNLTPPVTAQTILDVKGDGSIQNPVKCSPTIGNGGNYEEGSLRLMGKCERGGTTPKTATESNNKYLTFNTSGIPGRGNDRGELAYTPMLAFDKTYTISYQFRIPEGTPVHPRGQMFYPLQVWQCSPLSPIAGMRLVQGTSHEVDFMVRSQNSNTPVIARQKLQPGKWHQIELTMRPSLGKGGLYSVKVDGKPLGTYRGPFGADPKRCSPARTTPSWRLKLGIYRTNNPGRQYKVDYDNIKLVRIN